MRFVGVSLFVFVMETLADPSAFLQKNVSEVTAKAAISNQEDAGVPQCRSWCESDYSRGSNQGRHCSPDDMADLCGGCSFCGETPSCESWCESDYNGGNNQGRHCSPGDMADLCGGCFFCGGTPSVPPPPNQSCASWCESDNNGGNNQGRHCSPGDMADLCGGCSFCGGTPSPTPLPPPPNCASWCESDYNRGSNQGRHCSPGDMADLCGGCSFCGETPSPAPSPDSSIRVMSYNTEYSGYWDGRMGNFAAKIREVAPAIAGVQECQNRDGLASQTGYTPLYGTGNANHILFDSTKVSFVTDGWMRIPRDRYARRAITWGHFKLGNRSIFFFNTHLPHNHGEAGDWRTHGWIAQSLLQKRRELGIDNEPTIVTGDMNSHASNFNRAPGGGFESNLVDNGFVWAWEARGNPGYPRIDSILYSRAHWTHSNCGDTGTGSSDHTSIACTVTLK